MLLHAGRIGHRSASPPARCPSRVDERREVRRVDPPLFVDPEEGFEIDRAHAIGPRADPRRFELVLANAAADSFLAAPQEIGHFVHLEEARHRRVQRVAHHRDRKHSAGGPGSVNDGRALLQTTGDYAAHRQPDRADRSSGPAGVHRLSCRDFQKNTGNVVARDERLMMIAIDRVRTSDVKHSRLAHVHPPLGRVIPRQVSIGKPPGSRVREKPGKQFPRGGA